MNINLQFNNLKELDSFIKAMGYSKLAAQPEEAEKEVKQVNVLIKDPEPKKDKVIEVLSEGKKKAKKEEPKEWKEALKEYLEETGGIE